MPKMIVTAVYAITNNNEQRTMNYLKQTQTNPILSRAKLAVSKVEPSRDLSKQLSAPVTPAQASQTYAEGQEYCRGRFGGRNHKLKTVQGAGISGPHIVNLQTPKSIGILAIKFRKLVGFNRSEPAGKRSFCLLDRKCRLVIEYGICVIFADKKLAVRVIHIQTDPITVGALQENLQIEYVGVCDIDANIKVGNNEMVGEFYGCLGHCRAGAYGVRQRQIELAAVNMNCVGETDGRENHHEEKRRNYP
jgi:hypothetical protein